MDAVEADGALSPEVQQVVLEELDRCRERVIERIARTRKLTDEEVYHAGAALDEVVKRAQAYMTEVNERLTTSADSQGDVTATLEAIQRITKEQTSEVANALAHLADIAKAGQKIQELSGASRLLALNARVESARFGGEGGRAFNVIADEMRELSVSVDSTNTLVGQLARKLQEALPSIQDRTRAMSERVESLVADLEAQKKHLQAVFQASIEAGSEALEGILSSAREGLGHLQFQDLMIQDLEGIERVLKKSHAAVANALAAEDPSIEARDAFLGTIGAELDEGEASGEPEIESGEVLLF